MTKAELCPVCRGSGKYTPMFNPGCAALPTERSCHGCFGRGWVDTKAPDPFVFYPPQLPFPQVVHNSVSEASDAG